jgi:hypothetical protein
MRLITNIKKIRLYNCKKHQKQINILSKLLVFLLAINYTSSAVSGSPKTTYDRGLLTDSASETAALATKNYKFNKKSYCFFSHNIRH